MSCNREAEPATASSSTGSTAKRRRRSRTVANLSDEQIQQKRDQDRKAQRALRERNKNRVEFLEDALTRLKADQADQAATWEAQTRRLQEEVSHLRSQLEHNVLLQSQQGAAPSTPWESQHGVMPIVEGQCSPEPHYPFQSPDSSHAQDGTPAHNPRTDNTRDGPVTPLAEQVSNQSSPDTTMTPSSTPIERIDASQTAPANHSPTANRHLSHPISDACGQASSSPAIHNSLPKHCQPTTPLDHILLGFLHFHTKITSSEAAQRLASSTQTSLKAYLRPEFSENTNPISRLMIEVLSTFPHVRTPEKISFIYLMYHTMRVSLG